MNVRVLRRESGQDDGTAAIQITGDIDLFTASTLKQTLCGALDQGHSTLEVDLKCVDYIDSTGLSVLIAALRKARERKGGMRLLNLNRQLRRMFEVTGLSKLFDIEEAPRESRRAG